jgi:hypothetical protein
VFVDKIGFHEAKILAVKRTDDGSARYRVHYSGWNSRYDEDLDPSILYPYNESNLLIFLERNADAKVSASRFAAARRSSSSKTLGAAEKRSVQRRARKRSLSDSQADDASDGRKTSESSRRGAGARRKRGRLVGMSESGAQSTSHAASSIAFSAPEPTLKIMENNEFVTLPRPSSERIVDILDDYGRASFTGVIAHDQITGEAIRGIRDYFDQVLSVTLLYSAERARLGEQVRAWKEKQSLCTVFGVEHLCRLFVKLPKLLANSLAPHDEKIFGDKVSDLCAYIARNHEKYFTNDYASDVSDVTENDADAE